MIRGLHIVWSIKDSSILKLLKKFFNNSYFSLDWTPLKPKYWRAYTIKVRENFFPVQFYPLDIKSD